MQHGPSDEYGRMIIGMMIFPDVQLLDLAGPLDVFAALPGATPVLFAASSDRIVLPHGVEFTPAATFATLEHVDVLFVPGGAGIRHALSDPGALEFLAERGKKASYVTSVCTGALVLGAAGLLRGYRATTHWRYRDLLATFGAISTDGRVVRDRNRITGGGVTAGIDFALTVVVELWGPDVAQTVQLHLEYQPLPPFAAGSPDTAPASIVARVLEATQRLHDERTSLVARVMI